MDKNYCIEVKKKVFEEELKEIADVLGITVEYEIQDDNEVLSINNGQFLIYVNMDSTEAMKKDFLKGLANNLGKLDWIYTGKRV